MSRAPGSKTPAVTPNREDNLMNEKRCTCHAGKVRVVHGDDQVSADTTRERAERLALALGAVWNEQDRRAEPGDAAAASSGGGDTP